MSPCCRTIRPWHRFINYWSEIWLVVLSVQRRSSTDSSSRGCFGLLLVKMSKSQQNQQQIVCLASSDHSRETHTMFVNELQPTGDGNSIKNNVQKKHLNTKRNSRFYITHTHTHTPTRTSQPWFGLLPACDIVKETFESTGPRLCKSKKLHTAV